MKCTAAEEKVPYLRVPGLAFENATRSGIVLTLRELATTSANVLKNRPVIGTKILVRIERQALEQELIVDDGLARKDADRVAVRRRLRARPCSHIQPAAGPVLHHDRLAPGFLQLVGKRSGEDVSSSPRAERNDHLDRARRIDLSRCRGAQGKPNGDGDHRPCQRQWHGVLPCQNSMTEAYDSEEETGEPLVPNGHPGPKTPTAR